jgi:glycosyltransferase involved in cell wall biosynthesis
MRINICTGYPLDSPRGNTTTALRLAQLLEQAGYDATAMHTDTPPDAEVQISLHLLKTSAASTYFKQCQPNGRLIIRLTGTDINGGFEQSPELSEQVVSLAEKLIASHPACIPRIPKKWRDKVVVTYPSIEIPPLPKIDSPNKPTFSCIGHLRPVKNPHLMFDALQKNPELDIAAVSIGNAYDATDGQQALINARKDSRYRWMPGCDRPTAIAWTNASLATINSSISEGGANAVIEAICLGVPVLASRIEGNVGFLGENYAGFFDTNRADQLAELIRRCVEDSSFIRLLKQQLASRRHLFSAEQELASLKQLLG